MVAGITYNFLPFMTLPIYVSLEKIDKRLVEAAEDLFAGLAAIAGISRPRRRHGFEYDVVPPSRRLAAVATLLSESFPRITFPLRCPACSPARC